MSSQDEVRRLVRQVLEHGAVLPQTLRSALLARGPEAVGPLLELLREEALLRQVAPGQGFAPLHAAELLLTLRAPESLRPLVEALARTEPGFLLYDTLRQGLEAWGPAVAPVALEVFGETQELWGRTGLLSLLASCGARDERIFSLLLAQLRTDPGYAAPNLVHYGDARALGPLLRALELYPLEPETVDLLALQEVQELASAIVELGGTLGEPQERKLEEARLLREQAFGELDEL
jgi:hypothetical protein